VRRTSNEICLGHGEKREESTITKQDREKNEDWIIDIDVVIAGKKEDEDEKKTRIRLSSSAMSNIKDHGVVAFEFRFNPITSIHRSDSLRGSF